MKLQFDDNDYYLMDGNDTVATTDKIMIKVDGSVKKLSRENCDEIFGVIDVDKLAKEYAKKADDISAKYGGKVFGDNNSIPFKDGFNKSMELNKDKLFTVEDMKKAYIQGKHGGKTQSYVEFDDFIQSLQQPTEIEVEIEMEIKQQLVNGYRNQPENIIGFIAEYENISVPKLDENGCSILKKK